jgi:hypothetical protein
VKEYFVTCSKRIVLECCCGERLILLGLKADWRKEGRTVVECSRCREKLSLPDAPRRGSRKVFFL